MAANKKIASRRAKTSKDLLTEEQPAQRKKRLAGKTQDIQEEMHRLECFIAAAPRISKQQRLARIREVPPMERETAGRRRRKEDLPLQQQIAISRQKMMHVAELAVIGIASLGLLGWLNQYFHFLR